MSLRSHALLHALAGEPLPEWAQFAPLVRTRRYDAGDPVFHAEAPWPWLAVVDQGVAKLVYIRDDGAERVKSFIAEGGFFASLAALAPQGRASFSAQALTPLQLELLPYDALRDFGDRHLAWQRALRAGLQFYGARKEKRERELLTMSPQARYAAFLAEEPALAARIPLKDLALYLGVTPVALSRIRGRMGLAGTGAAATTAGAVGAGAAGAAGAEKGQT
jgi:CRP-like cAMP-binding protein